MGDDKRKKSETDFDFGVIFKAMAICQEDADGEKDVTGTVVCPKCGGVLHYGVSGYNGHMWGKCATRNCIAWME